MHQQQQLLQHYTAATPGMPTVVVEVMEMGVQWRPLCTGCVVNYSTADSGRNSQLSLSKPRGDMTLAFCPNLWSVAACAVRNDHSPAYFTVRTLLNSVGDN